MSSNSIASEGLSLKLTLHWESTGVYFVKLLRRFQKYLSKAMPLSANHEVKRPVVLLSRLKVCFRGWRAFPLCSAHFAVLLSLPLALANADGAGDALGSLKMQDLK